MTLYLKKDSSTWVKPQSIYVKTTNGWSTIKQAYVKISTSQWAQFYPAGAGITPRIEDSSGYTLSQMDGLHLSKLYGYIGSTTAGTYYYTWEYAVGTSSTPPSTGWSTETGTGAGGTSSSYVTQSGSSKQYVYYTPDSTDKGFFIRLKIRENGVYYYSNAVQITNGTVPTPTIGPITSTSTGFYFSITNYSTYTSGTYANSTFLVTDTSGQPLSVSYSINSSGLVTITGMSQGANLSGQIVAKLYPYSDSSPATFNGTSIPQITAPSITGVWAYYAQPPAFIFTSNSWGSNTSYVVVQVSQTKDASGNPTGTILSGTITTPTGYTSMPVSTPTSDQTWYWSATPYNSTVSPAAAGPAAYGSIIVYGQKAPTTAPTVTDSTSFGYTSLHVAVGDSNTTDIYLEFGATTNYELFNTTAATEIDFKSPSGLPASVFFGNTSPKVSGPILANSASTSGSLMTSASVGTTYYWRATPYNIGLPGPVSTGSITTIPLIFGGTATISGTATSGTTLTGSTSNWSSWLSTISSYYVVLQSSSDNVNWSDMSATAQTSTLSPASSKSYTVNSTDASNQTYFRAKASATNPDGTSAFVYSSSVRASTGSVSPTVGVSPTVSPSTTYYYGISVCDAAGTGYYTTNPTTSTVTSLPSGVSANTLITTRPNAGVVQLEYYSTVSSAVALSQVQNPACTIATVFGFTPTPSPTVFGFTPTPSPSVFGFVPVFGFNPYVACIHEDTLISTPSGYVKAKDLQIGDEVLSIDINEIPNNGPNGQIQYDYTTWTSDTLTSTDGIQNTTVVGVTPLVKTATLYFNGEEEKKFSFEQPIFCKKDGIYQILQAALIDEGDFLIDVDNLGNMTEVEVKTITGVEGGQNVYLFDMEPQDWYFAGDYLVHNK